MANKFRIAAVGDNCIDYYDETGEAYPGGNPVNVAVYAVRLGHEASYTGVVGTDEFGYAMIELIGSKGVDVSHLRQEEGYTAVTHVKIENGDRILGDYIEGVLADFKLTKEDIDFLASHDMVVTGIWGMIEGNLPALKAKGVPIAFDFADKYDSEIIPVAMPYVDYAFFAWDNDDEDALKTFMKDMKSKGAGMVIVTRGETGSIAYDGKTFTTFGIIPCDVVDTMGAGDSFIAGFLVGRLEGLSLTVCMEKGAKNASVTLGYSGAW